MPKKIYLIDGNSFIYRMFFALPEFSTKSGKQVNAVFGMAKFFTGQLVSENPDYIIFIKDAKGENFRHKIYSDYKATRERMPDNLRSQIDDIEKMIGLMKVPIIEIPGFEADDVIGTLAQYFNGKSDFEVDILTGDKDVYSLVSNNIKIYDTMKKKKFGPAEAKEKFGVESRFIIDYLAIVGDKSDNIPGIEGFGPKKAEVLINKIGSVEDIYNLVEKIEAGEEINDDELKKLLKGKTYEKLRDSKDIAFLSKKLASLDKDVKLEDFNLENFSFQEEKILNNDVKDFFRELEFFSLVGEENKKLTKWDNLGLKVRILDETSPLDHLITPPPAGTSLEKGRNSKVVIDTETTSLDIMKAELVGVSLYFDDDNIYYINRLHRGPKVGDEDLKNFLEKLFSSDILIIGHNLKYDLEILRMFMDRNNGNVKKNEIVTGEQMSMNL